MADSKAHVAVANRLAAQFGTTYNRGAGVDVQTPNVAIEVETEQTVGEAGRQLQGHRKPVYVAVTTQAAIPDALEYYKGTTIGVMDPNGRIVKPSTRR